MKTRGTSIRDQVFQTLGNYLRLDPARLHPNDSLRDDLGLDSLQTIELVYEVESAFDLQIPDEDFGRMRTINDVILYLVERTSVVQSSKTSPAVQALSNAPSPKASLKRRKSQ